MDHSASFGHIRSLARSLGDAVLGNCCRQTMHNSTGHPRITKVHLVYEVLYPW